MTATIAQVRPDTPAAAALIAAAEAELSENYPAEHRHGLAVDALIAQQARFHLATVGGAPAACGGYVIFAPGQAELKRMFVAKPHRGTGLSRRILAALEHAARAEGVTTMLLETGTLQHAASALYTRAGSTQRGPFAHNQPGPFSVFMEKPL